MGNSDRASTVYRIEVSAGAEGLRVDVFLTRALPDLSRTRIQQLARSGHVTVAGRAVKAGATVTAGAVFVVELPPAVEATPQAEDLPLQILHEDADIVVVNKPAGMVVHSGAGHLTGTLVNALLHHVKDLSGIGGAERPGIVHRLDRGTSGVMVIAKHDRAHRDLSSQFQNRTVTKEYLALVWGRPPAGLHLNRPIGRHRVHRHKMSGRPIGGRTALTTIEAVELLGDVSLLRVLIGTGRTHQIRVHLSEAGFPIVGDVLYGGASRGLTGDRRFATLTRPFLHAARLTFEHPRHHERVAFEAPPDDTLMALIETLRARALSLPRDTEITQ
jgi:23S rRNA pseudouridine1911/1915/1917 synthase